MPFSNRILSITIALALAAVPAVAAQNAGGAASTSTAAQNSGGKNKTSLPKNHVVQGSIVSQTGETLTVRSGKKDMTFRISSTTPKPSTMTPGSNVTVNYHDQGTQHIASSIEMAPTQSKATAASKPARK